MRRCAQPGSFRNDSVPCSPPASAPTHHGLARAVRLPRPKELLSLVLVVPPAQEPHVVHGGASTVGVGPDVVELERTHFGTSIAVCGHW